MSQALREVNVQAVLSKSPGLFQERKLCLSWFVSTLVDLLLPSLTRSGINQHANTTAAATEAVKHDTLSVLTTVSR